MVVFPQSHAVLEQFLYHNKAHTLLKGKAMPLQAWAGR
jgi:hypothetical protein